MEAAAGVEVVGDGGGGGHGLFRGGRGTGGTMMRGSLVKGICMVEISFWWRCGEMGGWWKGREKLGPGGGGVYMLGDGGSETMGLFLVRRTKGLGIGFLGVCFGGSTL